MALTNKDKQARKRAKIKADPSRDLSTRENDRLRKARSRTELKGRMSTSGVGLCGSS